MHGKSTTSSWLFPPQTREVQFDEKWSFVYKKQEHCDPLDPADAQRGDWWDHTAYDAEHKLVLCVVPGARTAEQAEAHQQLDRRIQFHAFFELIWKIFRD